MWSHIHFNNCIVLEILQNQWLWICSFDVNNANCLQWKWIEAETNAQEIYKICSQIGRRKENEIHLQNEYESNIVLKHLHYTCLRIQELNSCMCGDNTLMEQLIAQERVKLLYTKCSNARGELPCTVCAKLVLTKKRNTQGVRQSICTHWATHVWPRILL